MQKDVLLKFISPDKQKVVEPLIDKVLGFYGPNLQLTTTDNSNSQFWRDLSAPVKNELPSPLGRIELSTIGNTENALVHELLHLALPIDTGEYTFDQFSGNQEVMAMFASLSNMAEHDLMLPEYLDMGYDIDGFLLEGWNTINYKDQKKESKEWWMYEYFRIVVTKNHVGTFKKAEAENAIKQIRKYGIAYHPSLEATFKEIYNWIKNKKNSPQSDHAKEMKKLIEIFNFGKPKKYLSPDGNVCLKEVAF